MDEGTLCFPFESDVFRIPIKGTMSIIRRNGEQYTGYIAADDSYIIVPVDTAPTYRKEQPSHNFSASCPENVAASGAKTIKERLSELKDLYDDGLLEESEYKEKKKEILKEC